MLSGLLGRKVGMTQVFGPDGSVTAVTVIEAGPCIVTQIKTAALDGYEAVHYRLHFRRPRGQFEDYLRSRHLVHHEYYPDRCFGVTSALWDLVFGTEPMGPAMAALYESMRSRPPLSGCTNLYKLKDSVIFFRLSRRLASPPGRQ